MFIYYRYTTTKQMADNKFQSEYFEPIFSTNCFVKHENQKEGTIYRRR